MNISPTQTITSKNRPDEAPARKSSQPLMPLRLDLQHVETGAYNIYPVSSLGANRIFNGYPSLAQWIIQQKTIVIDGYAGVFWDIIQTAIQKEFSNAGLKVSWIKTTDYLKPAAEVDDLLRPFLGTAGSVWGTKCTLELKDIFDWNNLAAQRPSDAHDINVLMGPGSASVNWDGPVVYIDLPKNELQFRMRAGSANNLGSNRLSEPFLMYKRAYFVDWVLLNKHKKQILNKIAVIADGQWPGDINWMLKNHFTDALNKISSSFIRVRPWFEPGAWGGDWIKQHIPGVNTDVVNYAWSFELIVPENGLVFESDGYLLEVSFDFLMFHNNRQVLGKHEEIYGDEFPIRFDFLDTFNGGNLSIQCHPHLKYIQECFGETITQDETYYILDCKENSRVYLGFQENIDPADFKDVLLSSQNDGVEINIEDFVQVHSAKKHDLFLIPNGTIHSAGADNMVLEISATPYIFTFKMYDWLRLDLDGNPRPINIDHAFNNLDFKRKGDRVQAELISKQYVIEQGDDWQLVHLPTHKEHFYDVHRIEFDKQVNIDTDHTCHVLMLVEGSSILLETADGSKQVFAYAETFVVPAAAASYSLTNRGKTRARVIKAFLK